jgi:ribosome-binding factor A
MASRRAERMAGLIKEHVSKLLQFDIDDFADIFVTVTDVKVSDDFKQVKVYYSVLGAEDVKLRTENLLKKYKSRLRFELGNRIEFRFVPEFSYIYDDTFEKAAKIENIIKQQEKKENKE